MWESYYAVICQCWTQEGNPTLCRCLPCRCHASPQLQSSIHWKWAFLGSRRRLLLREAMGVPKQVSSINEGFYFLLRYKYIVVQNLIFSFQPSLAVQEADLSASADVKLVVHSDSHFIAVRCLEGAWQVNFTNKTHKWQDTVLTRRAEDKRSFWKKGNVWMINLSTVSFFQIVPLGELGSEEALDCAGGMFRALGNGGPEQQLDAPRSDNVEFVSACTGAHKCNLHIPADSAVISLKQQVAMKLQHLPFSVVLVAEGTVLALGSTWSGCFKEVGVILTKRTQGFAQDLAEAIQLQKHDLVIHLLELGQEPNCYGFAQSTQRLEAVLLFAAGKGYFYSTHLLLEAWADPNSAGNDRRTALHLAVCARSPTTVETLLWHGADVHAQDLERWDGIAFCRSEWRCANSEAVAPCRRWPSGARWRSRHKGCAHGRLLEEHVVQYLIPFELAGIVRQFEAALPKPLSHGACPQNLWFWCHWGGVLPASGDFMNHCHAVVHSAMSGAVLAMVHPEMDGRLCARWERKLACYSNAPFFSIAVLSDTGLVPEQMTWSELGCPRCVSIVSKQVTRHQTKDLFEAIEAGDAEGVRALLLDGQNPSCMIVETALNIAVVRGHKEIVGVLLRGGAAVNLIPPGVPHAPLHHAVIFGSIRICQQYCKRRLIQAFRIEEAAGPFTTP